MIVCAMHLLCLQGQQHSSFSQSWADDISWMQLGGSGVLVLPMTYIFDEEPERWSKVLESLQS